MSIKPLNGLQPQQSQPARSAEQTIKLSDKSEYKPVDKANFEPVLTAKGTKAISDEAVKKNIENLNELLKARQTNITMEYDNLSSPKMVNIIDASSGEVIRKMPPEGIVDIALKARDYIIGLMIDKTV